MSGVNLFYFHKKEPVNNIVDLGVDVSPEKFVQTAKEKKAQIIGLYEGRHQGLRGKWCKR